MRLKKAAEKSFGGITKQVHTTPPQNIPDISSDSLRQYQFSIDFLHTGIWLYGS